MFLTIFIRLGLQIFIPYTSNPTYCYIAYKDAQEGNPIHHQAILAHEQSPRDEDIQWATVVAFAKGPFSRWAIIAPYIDLGKYF